MSHFEAKSAIFEFLEVQTRPKSDRIGFFCCFVICLHFLVWQFSIILFAVVCYLLIILKLRLGYFLWKGSGNNAMQGLCLRLWLEHSGLSVWSLGFGLGIRPERLRSFFRNFSRCFKFVWWRRQQYVMYRMGSFINHVDSWGEGGKDFRKIDRGFKKEARRRRKKNFWGYVRCIVWKVEGVKRWSHLFFLKDDEYYGTEQLKSC